MKSRSSRTTRVLGIAASVVALVVGGASATLAAGGNGDNGSARESARAAATTPLPPGTTREFVQVTPCRVFDTRVAGGLMVNTTRTFTAIAANLSTQGGLSTGCGVPANAKSVMLTVGAIGTTKGHVRAWATGTAEPLASILNYGAGQTIANQTIVPLSGAGQLNISSHGSAQVFADVTGYYRQPLYAAITAGGTVYGGTQSGLVSVAKPGTGIYDLTFNHNINGCIPTTSDYLFAVTHDVSADTSFHSSSNTVRVVVTDSSNVNQNSYFYISLAC